MINSNQQINETIDSKSNHEELLIKRIHLKNLNLLGEVEKNNDNFFMTKVIHISVVEIQTFAQKTPFKINF